MRRILTTFITVSILGGALVAAAQQAPQISPKLKEVVDRMKAYATANPKFVNRTAQGAFYFKWIQSPPPEYQKAFFQLGELNVGKRFLSLKLIRQTSAGVELLVLNDSDMNGSIEEAYKATGRTLADADRAMTTSSDKLKIPVTPEMTASWSAMLDELKWELKAD
ncbi:MAG TPA: hypothetical protein VL084_15025 [Thermoanaerobaculia bacterium]|nr:hypothetical protein [Thermoanaerobaculia bacterium]